MSFPEFDFEKLLRDVRHGSSGLDVISVFAGVDVACYLSPARPQGSCPLFQHLGITSRGPHATMPLNRVMYTGQHFEHHPRAPRASKVAVVGNWKFNDEVVEGSALSIAKSEVPAIVALDIMEKGSATTGEIKRKMADLLPSHADAAVLTYDFAAFGVPLAGQRCLFVARNTQGGQEFVAGALDKSLQAVVRGVQQFCQREKRSLKRYVLREDDEVLAFYNKLDASAVRAGLCS